MMNCRPDLKGKLVTEGTWDFAIVDELAPQPGDIVMVKTRYSGFSRTALDAELQTRGIRYLFFTASQPMSVSNPRCATHSSWTIGPS
jgi:ureidoacrylate peracid hydrolase